MGSETRRSNRWWLRRRPCRALARRWHASRLVAAAAILALAVPPAAAQRQLAWRPLAVEARLEADGALWVREAHTMIFTGDWNGGERSFDLRSGQDLELLGLSRLDPESGTEVPLVQGDLARVDHYAWTDSTTLRWRSRLPTDPPFDETPITYVLEYRQEGVLKPRGEFYRLDHEFTFPQRSGPIEAFVLELVLDPVWRPTAHLPAAWGPFDLGLSRQFVVTVDLEYTGEGTPAAVRTPPPVALRAALFLAAALAIVFLADRFRRREAALGRFRSPPAPAAIDTGWLEEHLFDLRPEEAGALWDRKVGPPEVAAILARWQAEGRIESRVVPKQGWWKKDVMELELTAERDSFRGYEGKLMRKLFFDGRRQVDTEAIREHYRKRGFDPAATVRSRLEKRLARRGSELQPHRRLPGPGRRVTLALFLGFLALMGIEALGRPLEAFQLTLLLMVPLGIFYLLFGLVFAHVFRQQLTNLGAWSLGFVVPGLAVFAQMVMLGLFDRLVPWLDFPLQPGVAGTAAMAVLAVMVWSSLLNNAASRERPAGLERRQRLAAIRRLFARELARERPELDDAWIPYLLALGLGPRVDRWWRKFGGAAASTTVPARHLGSGGSASGSSWTGGGGAFGGAGATASWAAVAGSVAAGVAKPGSGGSGGSGGGGGGGGGGSSGGGGGGGW